MNIKQESNIFRTYETLLTKNLQHMINIKEKKTSVKIMNTNVAKPSEVAIIGASGTYRLTGTSDLQIGN